MVWFARDPVKRALAQLDVTRIADAAASEGIVKIAGIVEPDDDSCSSRL